MGRDLSSPQEQNECGHPEKAERECCPFISVSCWSRWVGIQMTLAGARGAGARKGGVMAGSPMKVSPDERVLAVRWLLAGNQTVGDDVCERINALVTTQFAAAPAPCRRRTCESGPSR
jgi:hypothetical protein